MQVRADDHNHDFTKTFENLSTEENGFKLRSVNLRQNIGQKRLQTKPEYVNTKTALLYGLLTKEQLTVTFTSIKTNITIF